GIVLAAARARADQLVLAGGREYRLRVDRRCPRLDVDVRDDVLVDRLPRPQELARFPVERVDEARLPGYARDDVAHLALPHARADPSDGVRVRRDGRLDQDPLERMIEIPVIDDVLEMPHDLAGIRV